MAKSIESILTVSGTTLGSRVLGLVRDVLTFSVFGGGAVNSAFLFAFTLPNLFRRLLGEGALGSALVPVFSEEMERGGRQAAFAFFNKVMTYTGALLLVLVLLGMGLLGELGQRPDLSERWGLGSGLGVLMMPYMLLVCLAAVVGGALNVLGRFLQPALSAVWINLAQIVFLGVLGLHFAETEEGRVLWLCAGVLVGGLMQLLVPGVDLWRQGWRPALDWGRSPALMELLRIFLPAVLGASIMQINVAVSRTLAFEVDATAVSVLYLANRLVELPLGVFAVAVTTVLFPRLSQLVVQGNREKLGLVYGEGLRLILAITVPASLGLILLAEPIVALLFEWGRFDAEAVSRTVPVLCVCCAGIPWGSFVMLTTRSFHAMKDTRTPLRVALVAFVVNLALSLSLMWRFGALGLAYANLGSVVTQAVLMHVLLGRREPAFRGVTLVWPLLRVCGAALGMGAVVWLGVEAVRTFLPAGKLASAVAVGAVIPVGGLCYFALLWVLRYEERGQVAELVQRLWERLRGRRRKS